MDVDADPIMEESIMQSTELNGDAQTIAPSAVFPLEVLKAPPAAIFGHGHSPSPHLSNLTDDTGDESSSPVSGSEPVAEAMDGVVAAPIGLPLSHVQIPVPKLPALPYASQRSGLVYDARM